VQSQSLQEPTFSPESGIPSKRLEETPYIDQKSGLIVRNQLISVNKKTDTNPYYGIDVRLLIGSGRILG
jgi:hypothetical protein